MKKVHVMAVTIRFDRPVTAAEARKIARNNLHGTFSDQVLRGDDLKWVDGAVRKFAPMPKGGRDAGS